MISPSRIQDMTRETIEAQSDEALPKMHLAAIYGVIFALNNRNEPKFEKWAERIDWLEWEMNKRKVDWDPKAVELSKKYRDGEG